MNLKKILIIIVLMTVIIGGIYYFISPYQNCLRTVDNQIEELRNKLATETDVKKREGLELEQEGLINQRQFGCSERTSW